MRLGLLVLLLSPLFFIHAQRNFDDVTITHEKLTDGTFVLFGAGGNMALIEGKEFSYLIDDQFAPLNDKIKNHIATLTSKPVKLILNTHFHGDHTGGNANFANSGAMIIAHDNVRKRMTEKLGKDITASDPSFPIITFNDRTTFYLGGGRSLHAMHVNDSHTDGDSYYYLPEDNVLHMGDNFFNGRYPYIDIKSGGDIDGLISNVSMALAMVNDETRIIPGHGKMAKKTDLQAYYDVLVAVRERIVDAREKGNSLEEVKKMDLTKQWDAQYGTGFINPARMVEFVYLSAD